MHPRNAPPAQVVICSARSQSLFPGVWKKKPGQQRQSDPAAGGSTLPACVPSALLPHKHVRAVHTHSN
eukprot:391248-Pelagomonas_calceolata.AAC.3